MADIAEIGFRADTAELVDAKRKLDALSPSAARTEQAVSELETALATMGNGAQRAAIGLDKSASSASSAGKAARGAAAAANENAAAAVAEAEATEKLTAARRAAGAVPLVPRTKDFVGPWGAVRKEIAAANDNVSAFKANTANIAAQFQDIGVTAAMGMSPLQIALQQGTQLSAVFAASGESAAKTLAAAFRSIISPVALVTIAIVGLVAAGLQLIDWVKVANAALNFMADILPTIAPYAIALGAAFAIAFAPAIVANAWSLAAAIGTGLVAAVGTVVAAIGIVPIAIGAMVIGFIAFGDYLNQLFGVDIVGYVKFAINYIIGSFVGAYHDVEFLWKNFPDIIGAAAIGAANLVVKAVNQMIKAASDGIDVLIRGVNRLASYFGADKAAQFFGFSGEIPTIGASAQTFDPIANEAADRLAKAVKGRNDQLEKDLTTDYVGALGGAINDASKWAADKFKGFAASIGADAAKKSKGHGSKTEGEKFEDITKGAERQIATLRAQQEALGLSEEATARLKYETQLLNEAQQKNIKLSPEQRQKLMELAGEMANLEVSTKQAKEAIGFAKDAFKGFVDDLASGLAEGKSFWEAFGNAALNVLDKIADKLLNDVMDALFQTQSVASGALGGASNGGGFWGALTGAIGGLFGGGGGFSSWDYAMADLGVGLFAKGEAFPHGISAHRNSIVSRPTAFAFASGAGIMGEAGPEGILPLARMGNGDLGVQMQTTPNANTNAPIPVNINVRVDGANGDKHVIDLVRQGVSEGLEQFDNHVLPARVNEISRDSRAR